MDISIRHLFTKFKRTNRHAISIISLILEKDRRQKGKDCSTRKYWRCTTADKVERRTETEATQTKDTLTLMGVTL